MGRISSHHPQSDPSKAVVTRDSENSSKNLPDLCSACHRLSGLDGSTGGGQIPARGCGVFRRSLARPPEPPRAWTPYRAPYGLLGGFETVACATSSTTGARMLYPAPSAGCGGFETVASATSSTTGARGVFESGSCATSSTTDARCPNFDCSFRCFAHEPDRRPGDERRRVPADAPGDPAVRGVTEERARSRPRPRAPARRTHRRVERATYALPLEVVVAAVEAADRALVEDRGVDGRRADRGDADAEGGRLRAQRQRQADDGVLGHHVDW